MKNVTNRHREHPIKDIFINRWSPRAMTGGSITDEELNTLFEAARWAPSSYNDQPWRFIYAKRDTKYWNSFFGILAEMNQMWCKNAAVLIIVCSHKNFEHNGNFSKTYSFDAGSAWQNLALQASEMNLVAHGMAGFDYEAAKKAVNAPNDFEIEAMIAIGRLGNKENLPEQLQEMESPSDRKKIEEIVFEGEMKK